jgi:ankyrin repeat protein
VLDVSRHVGMNAIVQGSAFKETERNGTEVGRVMTQSKKDPLFKAVKHGDVFVARQLLERGADANGHGGPGGLLGVAAWRGDGRMIQLLLDAGARVDAPEYGDWTPMVAAAAANHVGALRMLVAAGASVYVRPDGYPLLNWLEWAGLKSVRQETIVALLRDAGAKAEARWWLQWKWRARYKWTRAIRWLGLRSRIGPPPSGPPFEVAILKKDDSSER